MASLTRLKEAFHFGGLSFRELVVRTARKVGENEILTRAAAVSFYAMLASVPFLALMLTITLQLLPDVRFAAGEGGIGASAVTQLQATLRQMLPKEGYEVVADQIARIQKQPPVGLLSIGLAITLWTASSLFLAIIDAMNRIYGVAETRPFVTLRLTGMVMTVLQAAILVGSLVAIVAGPEILSWIGLRGSSAAVVLLIQWLVVVTMVLTSFALTFYVGPDAEQRWEWITPGSLLGTAAFLLGSFLFRLYVTRFAGYDKTYGSLGGVMVLLFWFWVSSVVLLAAGQMNKVIENASPLGKYEGQKIDPSKTPDLDHIPPEPYEPDRANSGLRMAGEAEVPEVPVDDR